MENLIEGINAKTCTKCNKLKSFNDYNKNKRKKYGVASQCKECLKEYRERTKEEKEKYQKIYRKQNVEKINQHKLRCNQRRRHQNKISGYTEEQWNECMKFFNYKCAYTGKSMKQVSVEHIIPISKNGTTYIWNLIPCELSINISKGNKDLEKWYKEQKFYSEERLEKIYKYVEYMKNKYWTPLD